MERYDLVCDALPGSEGEYLSVCRAGAINAPHAIVLHGLYSTKERYLVELYQLARLGFHATAIDLAMHGERTHSAVLSEALASHYVETMQTIVYDTAKRVSAFLDLWAVGQAEAGLFAVSAGGLAGHVLCITEERIGAAAAIITSPDWLTADPRTRPAAGTPLAVMLSSMSPVNRPEQYLPKALLMLVGEDDDVVSPEGSVALYERLAPRYKAANISERLQLLSFPGIGHAYTSEMRERSLGWLEQHLVREPLNTERLGQQRSE